MNIISRGRKYNSWAARQFGASTKEYNIANSRFNRLSSAAAEGYRKALLGLSNG